MFQPNIGEWSISGRQDLKVLVNTLISKNVIVRRGGQRLSYSGADRKFARFTQIQEINILDLHNTRKF